jgi:hypothetical protein
VSLIVCKVARLQAMRGEFDKRDVPSWRAVLRDLGQGVRSAFEIANSCEHCPPQCPKCAEKVDIRSWRTP